MLPSLGIPYRHCPFWVFILPIGFLLKLLFWLWLFFSTFKWWSVPRHSGCFSWSMSLFSETTLSSMAEKHHPYSYDISVSIFKLNLPLSHKLIQPTANSRPLWCPMHLKLVKNRIFTFFFSPATVDNSILKHAKHICSSGAIVFVAPSAWNFLLPYFHLLASFLLFKSYFTSLFLRGLLSHSLKSLLDSLYHLPCFNSL